MKLSGTCDECGREFNCEGVLLANRGPNLSLVEKRPYGFSCIYPHNRAKLPPGCTFDTESLKQHKVTTRGICYHCGRKPIFLVEVSRDVYGHDKRAINRHSERRFISNLNEFFILDCTLDGCPPFYELLGPIKLEFRGITPSIDVDGLRHWGDGLSWGKAIKKMEDVLNAVVLPIPDFVKKYGRPSGKSDHFDSYQFRSVVFQFNKDNEQWSSYIDSSRQTT